ncbi:hypothetical protein KAI58_00485 [Candidatus Gracilibacteria bacterium]|nr:hypothetical protein [Candidatus Gracilibacteria bacterium]
MNFLIENASELLRLAGALALMGVFILCLYLARMVYLASQVLRKANDLADLFITYIQKPISMIIKAEKLISGILNRFK